MTIQSTNPFDAPFIDPNMLDTQFDITTMVESIKAIKRFAAAPAWDDYITGTVGTLSGTTDADLEQHARQHTTTVFHPSSTASMSSQDSLDGVVNPDLTVKGTSGLRVVDLSVFVSDYTIVELQALIFSSAIHSQLPSSGTRVHARRTSKRAHQSRSLTLSCLMNCYYYYFKIIIVLGSHSY